MLELLKAKLGQLVTVSHPFGFCSDTLGYDQESGWFFLDGDGWRFAFTISQVIGVTGSNIVVGLWQR